MDPLGFSAGDYNLYRYAFNNPINVLDPTGQQAVIGVPLAEFILVVGFVVVVGMVVLYYGLPYIIAAIEGLTVYLRPVPRAPDTTRPRPKPGAPPTICPPGGNGKNAPPLPQPHPAPPQAPPFSGDGTGPVSEPLPQPETPPQTHPEPFPWPDPLLPPLPAPAPPTTPTPEPKQYLYHYTSDEGLAGILATQQILPSIGTPGDPKSDAQWGNGQYFTDITPQDASIGSAHQLSRALFTHPWYNRKVKSWVRVNVAGLPVRRVTPVFSRTYGDKWIYLHPSESPLNVTGRIDGWGATPFSR
jgi:hypothetical protein